MHTSGVDPVDAGPVYSSRTWSHAGWHAATDPVRVDVRVMPNRDGGHAGVVAVPVTWSPVDASTRRDLVDTVRRTFSDDDGVVRRWSARDLRRAVDVLRSLRSHPDVVAARSAHLDLESDGSVGPLGSAPDPWSARNHDTVTRTGRKGTTVTERRRVGIAPVIGRVDVDVHGRPVDVELSARLAACRRVRLGAVSFDVLRVTTEHYHGVVPDLVGTYVDTSTGVNAGYGYWLRVDRLVAPHVDPSTIWHGHTVVTRPSTVDGRGRRRSVDRVDASTRAAARRRARTVGTVDVPRSVDHVRDALRNLNRGERVRVRVDGVGVVTVTRSTGGVYARQYTDPSTGRRVTFRRRSVDSVARHVVDHV